MGLSSFFTQRLSGCLLTLVCCTFTSVYDCWSTCAAENNYSKSTAPEKVSSSGKRTWIRVNPHRSDFLVFTRTGQSFGKVDNSGSAVFTGAVGGVLSIDGNKPVLHTGRVLIHGGKSGVRVGTRLATVIVAPASMAMIDVNPAAGAISIANLSDTRNIKVHRVREPEVRELSPGKTEVLATDPHLDTAPAALSTDQIATLRNALIAGHEGPPVKVLGAETTEFLCNSEGTLMLRSGELFIQASGDTFVKTANVSIHGLSHAIFDVSATDGDVRTKAFTGPKDLTVNFADQDMQLSPGEEILVSTRHLDDGQLMPPDGIGRRRHQKFEREGQVHFATCDFSIVSFLNEGLHVEKIHHPVSFEDRQILEKMLKNAAAVQTVSGQNGFYRSRAIINHKREQRIAAPTKPSA